MERNATLENRNSTHVSYINNSMLISSPMAIIGIILNFTMFLVMCRKGVNINQAATILLRAQLVFDGLSGIALLLRVTNYVALTNEAWIYIAACLLNKRGLFLWVTFTASAYNSVAITIQRFAIIVFPLKRFTVKHTYVVLLLVCLSVGTIIGIYYGFTIDIDYATQTCKFRNIPQLYYMWLAAYYVLPCIILISCNAKIMTILKKRNQIQNTRNTSENRIIKNAITVGLIFVVSATPNTSLGLMSTYVDLPFWRAYGRHITYACTMVNSVSTPVVYLVYLSNVRREYCKVFFGCRSSERTKRTDVIKAPVRHCDDVTSSLQRASIKCCR